MTAGSGAWDIRLAGPEDYAEVGEITLRGYVHDGLLEPSDDYAAGLRDAASRAAGAELWVAADTVGGSLLGSAERWCGCASPGAGSWPSTLSCCAACRP